MSDTALQMADDLDGLCSPYEAEIAAELRRLAAENESLKLDLDGWADLHRRFMDNHVAVHALKDELVEALKTEREECAQIAAQWDVDHPSSNYGGCIASLIRSRT